MRIRKITALLLLFGFVPLASAGDRTKNPEDSNDIRYPSGWQNWAVIAVSDRTDNRTVRVILGNEVAVQAARSGRTDPWPDGAILAKVVWRATRLDKWKAATVPGEFVHVEFMLKDSKKYAKTYGWGWARWLGPELRPFRSGPRVCISCHTPVKNRDWVFTEPAFFPGQK